MKKYSSREVLKILLRNGWYVHTHDGTSHMQLRHPTLKGKATLPHPRKDVSTKVMKGLEKQTGLKF